MPIKIKKAQIFSFPKTKIHSKSQNYGSLVLWKRLTTETPHHGNASKTAFEEFPFYFGKSLKTGKG